MDTFVVWTEGRAGHAVFLPAGTVHTDEPIGARDESHDLRAEVGPVARSATGHAHDTSRAATPGCARQPPPRGSPTSSSPSKAGAFSPAVPLGLLPTTALAIVCWLAFARGSTARWRCGGDRARAQGLRRNARPRPAWVFRPLLRQRQLRRTAGAKHRAGGRFVLPDGPSAALRHRRRAGCAARVLQRPGSFQLLPRERPRPEHAAVFGDVAGLLARHVGCAAGALRVVAGRHRPDQRRRLVLRPGRTGRAVDRRRDAPARSSTASRSPGPFRRAVRGSSRPGRIVDGHDQPFDDDAIVRRRTGTTALAADRAIRAASQALDACLVGGC